MEDHKVTNIVFLMLRFLDGGIDTVLVEYLQHLSKNQKYHITLAINICMGNLEVFLDRIPENVEVIYLSKGKWLTHIPQKRILKRASSTKKIYDELILNPIRRYNMRKGIKRMAETADVFIDFDCCAYTFLKAVNTRKIAFFHFSFKQVMMQNRRRMERIACQLAHYDTVVTISHAMREEGIELFPALKDKMVVIYNAKDRNAILNRAMQKVDNKDINENYIIAVERLEESQKDISTLLRAYTLLRNKYGRKELLYIIGKGNSESELRTLADELGIKPFVKFLGFISNPYPWIKHSKMLVHSAKFEGLPTVLIEGLMLGKLMVATDCPTGPREILHDGKAGLLSHVGDAEDMAEKINELLTNEQLRKDIAGNAELQSELFTFDETDKMLAKIIR
jgi:glycosyltransferase involved in cell wall biosynthesis